MVRAPAKLNLFLELTGKRPDGYHDLDTVMVPISCYDTLVIRKTVRESIRIYPHWRPDPSHWIESLGTAAAESQWEMPVDDRNLIYRALEAVAHYANYRGGWDVWVRKRIPSGAGMGGASSDAASAIRAAVALLNLTPSTTELAQIAAGLGSDVPFFLGGDADDCGAQVSAMRATGRGEILEPLPHPERLHFLVAFPSQSLSTATVYKHCSVPAQTRSSAAFRRALATGDSDLLQKELFNRLAEAATILSPAVRDLLQLMKISGLTDCLMTGSGSACFALVRDPYHAGLMQAELKQTLRAHGVQAHVFYARTVSIPQRIRLTSFCHA